MALTCRYVPGLGYQVRDNRGRPLTARYLTKPEADKIMAQQHTSALAAALLNLESTDHTPRS